MRLKMPQSSPLAEAPEDFLHLVFQLLSQSDLYAICLVNRRFRLLATPFLYSSISFVWEQVHGRSNGRFELLELLEPPVGRLVRSIANNPRLARYVRVIKLLGQGFSWVTHRAVTPRISTKGLGLQSDCRHIDVHIQDYIALAPAAELCDTEMWKEGLLNGSMDAFVALLLSQTQNLEYLEIGPTFAYESRYLGSMLRTMLRPSDVHQQDQPYPRLEKVSFEINNQHSGTFYNEVARDYSRGADGMLDVLAFFYLPNVRHMRLLIENAPTFSWPTIAPQGSNDVGDAPPPVNCPVESLRLLHIREPHLDRVLAATPHLKSLDWEWSYMPGRSAHCTNTADLTRIVEILCHVKHSLAQLNITATSEEGYDDIDTPLIDLRGTLRGLADFDELRELQLPLIFLTASWYHKPGMDKIADVVPRNVSVLTITNDLSQVPVPLIWYGGSVADLVEEFLGNWRNTHPKLRKLVIWLVDEDMQTMEDRVPLACSQAGVECELRMDDYMSESDVSCKPLRPF